ncbi:MAG: sugar phosphate isomerase/epimerase [Verrucomicrobiales bacterium]|nr:sugar phosphate isomerase/epimerase [Verrucomicrobiales bacterium]
MTRRDILRSSCAVAASSPAIQAESGQLQKKTGIVTASLTPHFSSPQRPGKFTLLDFPQFAGEELGLEVIDFNTMNIFDYRPTYLDKLRASIAKHGCIATNLKMNQKVNMASPNPEHRHEAMRVYKRSIDAAQQLGCRWVRPLPQREKPDTALQKAAFDELIDYAGERKITVLVENFGWMMNDSDSVINLVENIGVDRVKVGIDTGNWTNNRIRYPALEKTFPHAVTCDFKAKEMTKEFEHPTYDLKRCFTIGWNAGFRGPWCLEHGNRDFTKAKRELIQLRTLLVQWIAEA